MDAITILSDECSYSNSDCAESRTGNARVRKREDWLTHRDIVINESERYTHLLYRLSVRYSQTPARIASATVAARDLLQQDAVATTLQELLEDMAYVYPSAKDDGSLDYECVLNMYVHLRRDGLQREDTCLRVIGCLSR